MRHTRQYGISGMLGIIDILRRKRLKKDMRHDERKIYPVYKNLRSIIFFYYLETPEDIGILDRCCEIFKNHRLNYTGFAYAKKKKIMMSARQSIKYDITIFGNRAVTLLGIPKQWFTAQFADKKYDLLINFNDKPDYIRKNNSKAALLKPALPKRQVSAHFPSPLHGIFSLSADFLQNDTSQVMFCYLI